jgi:hypothetical protein
MRRERADKPREPAPKLAGADIRSRQDLVADKVAQDFRNADFADFLVSHHVQAIMWPEAPNNRSCDNAPARSNGLSASSRPPIEPVVDPAKPRADALSGI